MTHWARIIGVAIGLCLAAGVMALTERRERDLDARETPTGPLISECNGAIRELVIHCVPEAAAIVERTYREFLTQLPGDITVHVVCPSREAFDDLARRIGPTACKLNPIVAGHAMTCWSRDRWLALEPPDSNSPTTLLVPRGEAGAGHWPQRAGDQRMGWDIAASLNGEVKAARSTLYFDGGDFVTDGVTVFVTPAVARRNVQHTVKTREELIDALEQKLKHKVVLLDPAPDHHAGMFMMVAGDGGVLVGDPGLAQKIMAEGPIAQLLASAGGCDFSRESQHLFDAVAAQCEKAGYRVVRMPTVPAKDGRTYLTYLNAIIDERDGHRIVYMPTFEGADALNRAAADVWCGLAYEVIPIDCTATYTHFGSLHCLVNVLRRENGDSPQ